MKKLLMLGGANSQVPAIKRAKELGYYVISCDYLPDNPGHQFSDEYVNISTTDKEGILRISQEKKIDGIIAYASDPSAETAAYVTDKLHLKGTGLQITRMLAEKDEFRRFQKENRFYVPEFVSINSLEELDNRLEEIPFPCIVKPVDSSGSKGITKVENKEKVKEAYLYARGFSRAKRVILEEIIETPFCQLHGDGFVSHSKLLFLELGDQRFRNCVPIGSSCPSMISDEIKEMAWNEVSRFVEVSGFVSGGINVEIRVTEDKKIYLIEVGPRTGGNYVPQLMKMATGFDEVTAVLQEAMGEYRAEEYKQYKTVPCFQYIIGAKGNGRYKDLWIKEEIKDRITHLYIHKKENDEISDYQNSAGVVGVAIMTFDSEKQMEDIIGNIDDYIKVILREDENAEA